MVQLIHGRPMIANRQMFKQGGFTLVELLVVISVITLLIALLLPALAKARDASIRAACASDRRQNGTEVVMYTVDRKGALPTATAKVDANGYSGLEPSRMTHLHGSYDPTFNSTFGSGMEDNQLMENNAVFALGTLARFGYVNDPRMLFCPAFNRSPSYWVNTIGTNTYDWTIDSTARAADWASLTSGALNFSATAARWQLGVVHYFGVYAGITTRSFTTLDYVQERYSADATVSPLLMSCRQSTWYQASNAAAQGALINGLHLSHNAEGTNAVLADGSGKWFSLATVRESPWQGGTNTQSGYADRASYPAIWLANTMSTGNGGTWVTSNFVMWSRTILR